MTLETAQILSTVGHKHGLNPPYRATHKNHPVVLWAGHNISNIIWTIDLLNNLLKEYSFRYKKNHASSVVYTWAQERMGDLFEVMPFGDLSDFTQCMPDKYKRSNSIDAYRAYYLGDKASFAKWQHGRSAPWWWQL